MFEGLLVLLQTNSEKAQIIAGLPSAVTEFAGLVSAIKSKSVEVDIATVGKVEAKYGAQDALIAALLNACAALYVLGRRQNSEEVGTANRKGARGTMNDLFDKTDELIYEELDRFMEMMRPTETELYNKYFSARVVKDLGIRHRTPVEVTAAAPVPAVAP